jgi:hypothetical protein
MVPGEAVGVNELSVHLEKPVTALLSTQLLIVLAPVAGTGDQAIPLKRRRFKFASTFDCNSLSR